jgi:peptidoglycan/xylan/chitin deacetylase (PgdA/CDA1 family)
MSSGWPPILMYHSISQPEDDPNRLCTSLERFEQQMFYLKRRGLRGVSMRELRQAVSRGSAEGLVGLTFDDGYEDFLGSALPVLESLGFSATVFVLAGMIGGTNDWEHYRESQPRMRLLGTDGIREVSERGFEIGSHGMNHANLTGMRAEPLRREVGESRRILEAVVGTAIEGFCYPYGTFDSTVAQTVREEGYAYACTIFALSEFDDYDLPRLDISSEDTPLTLAAKIKLFSQYLAAKRMYWRYPAIRGLVQRFKTPRKPPE